MHSSSAVAGASSVIGAKLAPSSARSSALRDERSESRRSGKGRSWNAVQAKAAIITQASGVSRTPRARRGPKPSASSSASATAASPTCVTGWTEPMASAAPQHSA